MKMEQILMSESTNNGNDLYAVVYGNSKIMSFMLNQSVNVEDLHPDALASYYVDYYFSQVNSAGFSKFVHASQWNADMNASIAHGLKEMNSLQHLEFFLKKQEEINSFSSDKLDAYLENVYYTDCPVRAELDEDKSFYWLDDEIVDLNGQWLKDHKDTKVLSMDEIFLTLEEILGRPIER